MAVERKRRRRPPADRAGAAPPVRLESLRILLAVTEAGGNSSLLLERGSFANPADRALATELVLGVLRRLNALDAHAAALASRPLLAMDAGVRAALRLGLYQLAFLDRIPAHAAVGETVEAAKRYAGPAAAAFVNAVLRGFTRRTGEGKRLPGPEDAEGYLTTTLSLPSFLARRWRERFGLPATRALAEAAARNARTTLRVVMRRASPEEVTASLSQDKVVTRPGKYLVEAVRIEAGVATRARVFRQGKVFAQDEAAQMVARLVAPQPGERILDAAAAPGGKTLALSDLAQGGASIFAADLRLGRLRLLRDNCDRVRPGGVHLVVADAARPPFRPGFHRILLDAPCSGTGTLGRNPELRYRVDDAVLLRSGERALQLLEALEPMLRPRGRLVYATCSLEPEENDAVIARFLAARPNFLLRDPRADLPAAAHGLVGTDLVLRTQPGDVDLDGFTAFVLEKRG